VRSRSSPILMNFGPLFRERKFSTANISDIFCTITKFGMVRGLANQHLFSEFRELWSRRRSAIPCGELHQSFTDALVMTLLTIILLQTSVITARKYGYVLGLSVNCLIVPQTSGNG